MGTGKTSGRVVADCIDLGGQSAEQSLLPCHGQCGKLIEINSSGKDFSLPAGTLTFLPGKPLGKTFTIRVIDDKTRTEVIETVKVRLSAPVNAALGTADLFTLSITDNDVP